MSQYLTELDGLVYRVATVLPVLMVLMVSPWS
jgi:hypothetical protein